MAIKTEEQPTGLYDTKMNGHAKSPIGTSSRIPKKQSVVAWTFGVAVR